MKKMAAYQQGRLLLTRILAGFLIALLFISGSKLAIQMPVLASFLFLAGCVLVGLASLGRLWCSLYIAGHKTKDLVVLGPYSICRNPLYFFSLLGGIGVGLITETVTFPLFIFIAFKIYYLYVIRFEEKKLRAVHGQEYDDYFKITPQFWPKWSLLTEPESYVVNPKLFKKHIFSALWFIWLIGILKVIWTLRDAHVLKTYFSLY